jgi:hypothetical protein
MQPARDAAVAFALAVVVDQARAPLAPHRGVLAARDQACVLDRDHRLVVVAVERPGLHLALAALTAVQQLVERVQPVIAPRPDVA